MKYLNRTLSISIAAVMVIISSCGQQNTSGTSGLGKADTARNHKNSPDPLQDLKFLSRATIRPIYVETVKDQAAEHKGYQLHVQLKNFSATASYRKINLKITYYSGDKRNIGSEDILIDTLLRPEQSIDKSYKVRNYQQTSYQVKLTSALKE